MAHRLAEAAIADVAEEQHIGSAPMPLDFAKTSASRQVRCLVVRPAAMPQSVPDLRQQSGIVDNFQAARGRAVTTAKPR